MISTKFYLFTGLFFAFFIGLFFKFDEHKILSIRILGVEKTAQVFRSANKYGTYFYFENTDGKREVIEDLYLIDIDKFKSGDEFKIKYLANKPSYPIIFKNYFTLAEMILSFILGVAILVMGLAYGSAKSDKFHNFFRTKYPFIYLSIGILIYLMMTHLVLKTRYYGVVKEVSVIKKDKGYLYYQNLPQSPPLSIHTNPFILEKVEIGDKVKIKYFKSETDIFGTSILSESITNTEIKLIFLFIVILYLSLRKKNLWMRYDR